MLLLTVAGGHAGQFEEHAHPSAAAAVANGTAITAQQALVNLLTNAVRARVSHRVHAVRPSAPGSRPGSRPARRSAATSDT